MKSFLHLSNGASYEGTLLTDHHGKEAAGEIVFFTGMTGYQEVLTDPSYSNQIVVFTYPLIGNYGINRHDFESKKPHLAGVAVYEGNMAHSHYQSEYSLAEYLNKWNIPLISRIDTRAVVKQIRRSGSMDAAISEHEEKGSFKGIDSTLSPVADVSVKTSECYGNGKKHIVLMDFGYKKSILQTLVNNGCRVTVVPYNTAAGTIHQLKPDGILLSNGPGDPKQLKYLLGNIKNIASSYPTMGICLGHQLAALAFGGNTKKMLFGHRGANQPVMDLITKKVYMSSQNHSFMVDESSLDQTPLRVRYRNVNDGTVEGLMHKTLPIMTAQYHPEAHPGPAENIQLFHDFLALIDECGGREKVYA
ncbi:carbamoyl phosphate synthase small subunit [Peribacillus sp. B-H-3]|uniref:carbamoyl phosphate synthase small subunit n=1 Tax=Peribacillus sp. B-H-3 TaxID=3400420 RepID=UPI003B023ED4